MKPESLTIAFEGENYQIDANTLINTLIHYKALIGQINEMAGEGQRKIDLKVNAPERGSFILDITIHTGIIENIFSSAAVNYTAGIVTIIGGVFSLYKHFQGKPAKEDDDEVKKIINGNSITVGKQSVVTIYNDRIIRSAISKSIETAENDDAVNGISISGRKNLIASIQRDEFATLVYDDFDREGIQEDIKHVIIENATLGIVTLSFDRKKNWEFIYDGFKISMPVRDSVLSALVDNGMRFAKGDSIVVKLEIVKKYNPVYNAYQNKKFRIVEFLKHIPGSEQASINF